MKENGDTLISVEDDLIENFFSWYIADGFGARPKKEIDIRVFYILKNKLFLKADNYTIANDLRIPESKVKSLLIESGAKFQTMTKEKALSIVFKEIKDNKNNLQTDNHGNICLNIEDPSVKREFVKAAKDVGYFTDYSFNDELIRCKPHVFVRILIKNKTDEKKIMKVIKENTKDQDFYEKYFDKSLPLSRKIEKVLKNNEQKIKILIDVIGIINPIQ